ncbi:MAG: FecR family protein [Bacteroidales bacterium]
MTDNDIHNELLDDHELEKVLSEMKGMTVPASSRSKEDAWRILMQSVVEQEAEAKVVRMSSARIWFAVAASVVVLIVAAWSFIWFSSVEKYSVKGEMAEIILPDGSEVMLNADSKITYPRFFNIVGRKVTLDGEAFFKVTHGDRFTVIDLQKRKVEVVGTEFDVNSRGDDFRVKCFQGAVDVSTPQSKKVRLNKGARVNLKENQLEVSTEPLDSIAKPAWINGEFFFDSVVLREVFKEIERQFNVSIRVDGFDSKERKYTGFFRNNNLKEAMDLVTMPMGLTYQINSDSTIVIIRN